jgi:hypothetical protein
MKKQRISAILLVLLLAFCFVLLSCDSVGFSKDMVVSGSYYLQGRPNMNWYVSFNIGSQAVNSGSFTYVITNSSGYASDYVYGTFTVSYNGRIEMSFPNKVENWYVQDTTTIRDSEGDRWVKK